MIYQAISSLESGLLATPPERLGFGHANNGSTIPDTDEDGNVVYPEARLEIENGLHQLETLLEANVDKAFDKFEIYVLRNILTVPEDLLFWVRLKHYEVWHARSCGFFFFLLYTTRGANRIDLVGTVLHIEPRCTHSRDHSCPAKESPGDSKAHAVTQRRIRPK